VGYADIDRVSVLVELALESKGHVPEVSYGTHFFQDIVESDIMYVPVYPDVPESAFNHAFWADAPDVLVRHFPDLREAGPVLRLIDLSSIYAGRHARLIANPEIRQALCYLV